MQAISDRECALRTRRGDVQAYGELVRRYQASVFNVCYRLMGERRDAEDMAQEAFVRAHERLATYDIERPFGPWMRRVAANLCLNRLSRHDLVHVPLDEEHDHPDGRAGDAAGGDEDRAAEVRAAMESLSPQQRMVIELRHFQDMTYEEISGATRLSLSQVRTHLYRGRRILARKLACDV
jgi:RNA polymerase sigma-70 factor (ECF subfamily)